MKLPNRHDIAPLFMYRGRRSMSVLLRLLIILFLGACSKDNNKVVYVEYVDIPSQGWSRSEYCGFNTAERDSTLFCNPDERYDICLSIRHTGNCPYATLIMPAVQSVDSCSSLPDTIYMRLTDDSGNWRGNFSKGLYMLTDTIVKGTPLPPLYSLRLYHAMPHNLTGLLSVGLIILSSDTD